VIPTRRLFGFRFRQYLTGSLWVIPLLGAILGGVASPISIAIDHHLHLPSHWAYAPSTATTILAAVVGAAAALAGFVVTVSVLVVQIAEGSLSSRYMRIWFRDRLLKLALAVLLGTLTFSMQELRWVGVKFVPNGGVTISELLLVVGLVVFLLFLDRALHRVRPVAVAALIVKSIRRSVEDLARAAASPDAPVFVVRGFSDDDVPAVVVTSTRAGALQAIEGHALLRYARKHDLGIVLLHTIGDFVSNGAPLFAVYGTVTDPSEVERRLRRMVALGNERTIDQDPAFGIRIMVDIANTALSPAVNDPTTAVQIVGHLGEALRVIGTTVVPAAEAQASSKKTRPFVIVPTRDWADVVELAVTEIREFGASSVQVNRRLRAMLESVRAAVPPTLRPPLDEELARLDASVATSFAGSVDLDRARVADPQGLGGRTR
jgi:uncharacterized membrane protein